LFRVHIRFVQDAGFEMDELKPNSCKGHNLMGGLSTTLIDSLDMLAILGDSVGFTEGVDWVTKNIRNFDKDSNVSVFETNIRILGGLLSAHLIASNATLKMYRGVYDGSLLNLAVDLADRLLVAFDTPTRLPFGTVNLRRGVPKVRRFLNGEKKLTFYGLC
jgi:mannosidase alpha-like ER degradation enhancer 2